jgi:hypothetical protein
LKKEKDTIYHKNILLEEDLKKIVKKYEVLNYKHNSMENEFNQFKLKVDKINQERE